MDATEYIARFAEFFTEIVKMIKELIAKLSGGEKDAEV